MVWAQVWAWAWAWAWASVVCFCLIGVCRIRVCLSIVIVEDVLATCE